MKLKKFVSSASIVSVFFTTILVLNTAENTIQIYQSYKPTEFVLMALIALILALFWVYEIKEWIEKR